MLDRKMPFIYYRTPKTGITNEHITIRLYEHTPRGLDFPHK